MTREMLKKTQNTQTGGGEIQIILSKITVVTIVAGGFMFWHETGEEKKV